MNEKFYQQNRHFLGGLTSDESLGSFLKVGVLLSFNFFQKPNVGKSTTSVVIFLTHIPQESR